MSPLAKHLPETLLATLLRQLPPRPVAHLTGIRSAAGAVAEGWFIVCTLTPHQLLTLPAEHPNPRRRQNGGRTRMDTETSQVDRR